MADVRKLLISISRQIPEVGREQIVFLSEAVLPVAKVASCKGNLSDIYECLTNSTEYKDKALHLMIFLMKSVSCPRCDELLPFIRSRVTAPIPKLALRKLLMDVANNLHGDDVQYFIRFAATDLTLNAQSFFTADANHCVGLLELFKYALKRRVISTKDVSKLKGWLKDIEDESIVEFVQEFDIDEKLCLPSCFPADGESAHAHVRSLSGPESVRSGTRPQGKAASTAAPATVNPMYSEVTPGPTSLVPTQANTPQHLSSIAIATASSSLLQHSVLPLASPSPNTDHPTPHSATTQPTVVTQAQQEHTGAVFTGQSAQRHVKQLQTRFLDLMDCTYEELAGKGVDVHRLHARLVSLDVSRKNEHQEFIDNHLMKVNEGITFTSLWAKLSNYCDFLNFDLLEHVISNFGSKDLNHKTESYKRDLQSFRKATRLCDFISCLPVKGQAPATELRGFAAKVGHNQENCTLEDLSTLEEVIAHKFFLPKFALRLRKIMESSNTIMWLIPVPFVKCLWEAIESTSSEFFLEQKIITIAIDGQECYPSPTRKPIDYLKEHFTSQSTTEPWQSEKLSVAIVPEKLDPFMPSTGEEETLLKEMHTMTPEEETIRETLSEELPLMPRLPTHLGGTNPRSVLSGPTTLHTVEEQVQYFENKFGSLSHQACQEVSIEMEPFDFLCRVTYLPVSARALHSGFIENSLSNIQPPMTYVKIWATLNLYWNFLNYEFLEHVINGYGSKGLKQQMQDYVDKLSRFKQSTRLCEFIKSWPCRDEKPPEDRLKNIVVKMKQEWSQCTLQDVEQFKKALVHKFFLPEFDILLQKVEQGCVCVVWLTSPSTATLLQKNLANIDTEFFKEHGIDSVTIDGQDVYLTSVKRYGGYLREIYNSKQHLVGIGPPTSAEKLLPFKLARIEKEVSIDEFTRWYLRGDMDDVSEFCKKSPIKFEEVGKISSHHQQNLILIEGAPGVGKTTFSWEFCRTWGRGEILQGHSLLLFIPLRDNNLKEAKSLLDLFYHPNPELQKAVVKEITRNQGQGVAIWLEAWDELHHEAREKESVFLDLIDGRILPLATVFITSRPWASEHLRENFGQHIAQHVEILTSVKDQVAFYVSKAEAEAQPSSFPAKFAHYLSSNPAIKAAMYTPVTAKMSAEVFTWSLHTESPLPTTVTELFTAFTIKTLVDHLSTHPVHHKQPLQVNAFSDLPPDVFKQFQGLCKLSYEGILNRQQLVFSVAHLPTGFATLSLMQEVPQLYTEGRASSYHFIHLTLQEYLAAVHISQLPLPEQKRLVQEHLDSGNFKMTMKFYAGLTRLINIPSAITEELLESYDTKLTYFHFLFEAKDNSMISKNLGTDEMVVKSCYYWTPLDYFVTGHAISHSNCPWRLKFFSSSIDDKKFELFCQGCAGPGETGCRGYISHGEFWDNEITSKSIKTFVKIPPSILQDMRELKLTGNKLDGVAYNLLAKAILLMPRLEVLWLARNPIGTGGAVEVVKALCGSAVKLLSMSSTGIGVPDCEALCQLLKSSVSIQFISIYLNNLPSECVASIISGISRNSSLTKLNISDSHFSFANVFSLALVLREGSLTWLVLQNCRISGQGTCELAAALSQKSTLKYLNLNRNPIGMEGASSMSVMLQRNTSLEELHLSSDSVGEEGVYQLINSLKHNQTLRELWLPKNYETETSDHRINWR